MWLPCNFGETILAREHRGYDLEECKLVGLTNGIYNGGVTYAFKKSRGLFWIDLKDTIAFWPNAFNNEDCYDKKTLKPREIDLAINIGDIVKYCDYFDTKKKQEGRCISIMQDDGMFKYTFVGSDNLHVNFAVDNIILRQVKFNTSEYGQLNLL